MALLAFLEGNDLSGEETGNEWCEPVDDEAYNGLE